uniref:Etoposide-induced protein 2.4 n=1 Tax=Ascaris suum TaxID=6253 RepID=F1L3T6_ASCSU
MLIRHFVVDYLNGLRSSFYGFFVLHKLDTTPSDASTKSDDASSRRSESRVTTVLKQRRLANANAAPKASAEELEPQKPTAVKRVLQCMGLNVACVIALQFILLPIMRLIAYLSPFSLPQNWTAEFVSSAVGIISILPFFVITRLVNALWFSDIANASLKYRGLQSAVPISFSRAAADFVVAILVEVVFLLQSLMMVYLPIPLIAPLITFFHLSLLHALYSFEYFWMSQGFELKSRLAKIERCWPYFMGFGTPLTLVTMMSNNFIVNGCLFGMFFPFFIISSYLADVKVRCEDCTSVPSVHIFWPSLIVTNRISAYISELASVKSKHINVPQKRASSAHAYMPSSYSHHPRSSIKSALDGRSRPSSGR